MAEDWTRAEVEATVGDYFAMLDLELRGAPFNKAEHRRALAKLLNGRSEPSIEFKHCNISAVLNDLGFPAIEGYKPRSNYQRLLAEVVADRLKSDGRLVREVAKDVESPVATPNFDDILAALSAPPQPLKVLKGLEKKRHPYQTRLPRPAINYLEREARNRELGAAGEEFVIRFEQARLSAAGEERLAGRIEHTSALRGDGAGYDILSFETDGRERLIEVKTTRYARETPFFLTRNEVEVSKEAADRYHLYRCFGFRRQARLFTLQGSLTATCTLDPAVYMASVA